MRYNGYSPKAKLINPNACDRLRKWGGTKWNVFQHSILDIPTSSGILNASHDFVLIKGVLIHINPASLQTVYRNLYDASAKYICVCEYYNPTPVSITYRGHEDRLFKRDFAGEIMDLYPDLKLVDYGFIWRRDNNFPDDDANWFLLEK